ncbi:MAG: VCBS repeat-containing protein [Bacteroidia bacterium]|nr:VCBS repeat-containing protein [Bacteroidia bacterium]
MFVTLQNPRHYTLKHIGWLIAWYWMFICLSFGLRAQVINYDLPRNFSSDLYITPPQEPDTEPVTVIRQDFNGDGVTDRAQAGFFSNTDLAEEDTIKIFLSQPGGGEELVAFYPVRANENYPYIGSINLESDDINNDGHPDLIYSINSFQFTEFSPDLTYFIFLGQGDGTFSQFLRNLLDVILVKDMNGDGQKDLVLGANPGRVSIQTLSAPDNVFTLINEIAFASKR